jgi:undecaprenyl-diphosphatase
MSTLEWIDHIDKAIFILINHDADQRFLDPLMLILRNPYTWIPLYFFMLYFIIVTGKSKAWLFIILTIMTFAITDSVASSIMKPIFERLRPCYDLQLAPFVRGLVDCGGRYSFPSSHAANHFGLAAFWYRSFFLVTGKK